MKMIKGWMLGLVLVGCGGTVDEAPDAAPVVDGQELQGGATTTGFHAVGLVASVDGAICTGTLVAPRVVLTAAHCAASRVEGFYTGEGAAVRDMGGDLADALDNMERHPVQHQAAHPDYDPSSCGGSHDVALLWLDRAVTGVTPVALAEEASVVPGLECVAVGFGMHGTGTRATFARKRVGREQVIAVDDVTAWARYRTAVADHGDSGGPLLCGGHVAGVVSCGDERSPRSRVIAYAKPQPVKPWMLSVIRAWSR